MKKQKVKVLNQIKNTQASLIIFCKKILFLTLTDPDELHSITKILNSNKATGPNSVPTEFLKVVDKAISVPLANKINL